MPLVVKPSTIHETGCYTTSFIPKGTFVVEYTGPRLTIEEADERYSDHEETYLFGLTDGKHVVDGFGEAAFINHSCDPNCETDEIGGRIWIIALRDIEAGEELTYDYNLYDGAEGDESPCHCGTRNCRGTLFSEEETERRGQPAVLHSPSQAPKPRSGSM
jgi:SET domain-containing protein